MERRRLSEVEENGIKEILKMLSDDELFSLAATITKRHIDISSIEEAVRAIMSYTESPGDLLRRQKVRRDMLFQYLHEHGVAQGVNDEKLVLMQRILQHWGSKTVTNDYLLGTNDVQRNIAYPDQRGGVAQNHRQTGGATNEPATDNGRVEQVRQDFNCWLDRSLRSTDEDQTMALQFTNWFYVMLNACNPTFTRPSTDAFGPQHFYADCVLYMLTVLGGNHNTEQFDGADITSRRLTSLVQDELVLLNPNTTGAGVKGLSDAHGRRVIVVCGTVHRGNSVLGLFEQQFGLVRDPLRDNNWKIKSTRLALLVTQDNSLAAPTLEDTRNMLTFT